MLRLQAARVPDEKIQGYFTADQTRVMAIALVHESLSRAPELGKLDFPGYAKNLASQLAKAYLTDPQSVRIHFDVEPLPLELPKAIPCGLIVNELVTNSLRHAFPDNRPGEILIRFGQMNGHNLRLVVRDNGVGFPKGLDFKKTSTLGLMLVTGLTEQLGGEIVMRNHHGTEFDVSFPANGNARVQTPVPTAAVEAYPSHQSVS
jgi:two-component sensor histidine kinase